MAREGRKPLSEYQTREQALIAKQGQPAPEHSCWQNAEYVETDGALGQAYYCSVCGELLQVG